MPALAPYELIDFVAVLIGYAVSGEPTLLAFYERLSPFAEQFMALFGRNQLPHRSTLSRFLAALDQPTVEALRKLFQTDLVARKPFSSPGRMVDRTGLSWWVVDVDGTRAIARQRALPQTELPIVVSIRFARRAIKDVSEEKWCGRARSFSRRIRTSFWSPLEGLEMGIIGASCCGQSG